MTSPPRQRLSTPRAAAWAGVLFALLMGTTLTLIRTALPEGAQPGSQWLVAGSTNLRVAALAMPFAGITFLWFIGVVRDGFGRFEDKFFATVFIGSGVLFLAMMFVAAGIGAGLEAANTAIVDPGAHDEVARFGRMVMLAVSKTYALRMAAVFMMSLATIWLKAVLMPKWLVAVTYSLAVVLLLASELTMWLTLAFPVWALVVSLLLLSRSGAISRATVEAGHHAHSDA